MKYRKLSVAPVDRVVTEAKDHSAGMNCWNNQLRRLQAFPIACILLLLLSPFKTGVASVYICLQMKSVRKNKSIVLIDILSPNDQGKNLLFC
jgi:hypothetical protein